MCACEAGDCDVYRSMYDMNQVSATTFAVRPGVRPIPAELGHSKRTGEGSIGAK